MNTDPKNNPNPDFQSKQLLTEGEKIALILARSAALRVQRKAAAAMFAQWKG
jgi:hypothetical protein